MLTIQHHISRIEGKLAEPDQNGCLVWTASTTAGYGRLSVDRKLVRVHRFVFEHLHGKLPATVFVDHICGNRGCVNPQHLRAVTQQQNNEHRTRMQSSNTSGYPGVHWHKRKERWAVEGKTNGIRVHLGYFPDAWSAYCVWREWAADNMPFVDARMLQIGKQDEYAA